MKKSELIEGVEYACFLYSGDTRAWNRRRSSGKPFKAKLISTSFVEQRWVKNNHWGYRQEYTTQKAVIGIAVDSGEKVRYEAKVPQTDSHGKYLKVPRKDGVAGDELVLKEETFEYDYIVLKDAGHILMPWDEYEARIVAQAERETRAKIEAEALMQARTDAANSVLATVDAVNAALAENHGDGEINRHSNGYGINADETRYVSIPVNGIPNAITVEYAYGQGANGRVVTGVTYKMDEATLAAILGVTVKEEA